ncbi:hypothetical protein [Halogranum rubrum]|uniref:hypothetical protein n=1 Tax=Halogranum rubrum TaxID=553466 RepID=UPI000677CEE2|nr:hypothetical protein [Halogranum salarium]
MKHVCGPSNSPPPSARIFTRVSRLWVVVFVPIGVVASVALPPDPITELVTYGLTALISVPLAVRHVRAGKPLAPLGEFFVTVFAIQIALAVLLVPLLFVLVWQDVAVSFPESVRAVFVLGIHVLAFRRVYPETWAQTKATVRGLT